MQDQEEIDERLAQLKQRQHELDKTISQARKEVRRVQKEINELYEQKSIDIKVTYHAIIKYVERVMGIHVPESNISDKELVERLNHTHPAIDIDEIKQDIKNEIERFVNELETEGKYTFKKGHQAVVRDTNVVVTIL